MRTVDESLKAMSLLNSYVSYVRRKYGKDLARKVVYAYNAVDEAVKYVQDEHFNGNDIDIPEHIDLLVSSVLNIKPEEIDPVIVNDWEVLSEAD